jgi:geranylgeranyl reductase family protein
MRSDVVVIGAGPSGSAAGYWLARSGFNVLLVDQVGFPRSKPCGDGLTPHALDLLDSMELDSFSLHGGRSFKGVRISGEENLRSVLHLGTGDDGKPRHGLVVPRRRLDDALCRQAIGAGARFLPGFRALAPSLHRGRLAGLQGRHNGRLTTIEAPLIIVATGANRKLLGTLGLSSNGRPDGLALRAYLTDLPGLDDYLEVFHDPELFPGYAWVFPTGKAEANVGVGIRLGNMAGARGGRQLRSAFDRFLSNSRLSSGRLVGPPQGGPVRTDFPAIPTYSSGVLVVGETAGLVNPLTGEGIAMALESGRLAAEAASEALSSGRFSGSYLRRYDDLLRERYAGFFEDARELVGRLADRRVLEAVIQHSQTDERVRQALSAAVVHERPRDGKVLLSQVLGAAAGNSLARCLFTINEYRPLLDQCRLYLLEQVRFDAPSPAVLELIERGKMLRALLVFLGCQAAGGDPVQVLAGAAGIELVHAASLIHDDIMDHASTRRGLPALHTLLGTSQAMVVGDYLIAKAFRLLAESRISSPAARVVEAFIIGAESGIRTCAGQFLDVIPWSEVALDESMYDRVITGKTAAAIAGALMAGAALAGGDKRLLEALSLYGECVGRAFQIRDDIIELASISSNGCAIDRRPTLPLIHAFRHSDASGREIIRRFLDKQEMTGEDLTKLLHNTGSLAHAEAAADSQMDEAIQLASKIPEVQDVLEAVAHYVVIRDH